ncbi:MAG: chemotaxis protein CheW [Casimicrobiaceae bacterium]|nr:chemotaxis protein CheW [Casimicrobiaceae bacterium]MCX8098410.1 chemotaxis protein CheW [Casimicrobiaceae bacterium]MDW8311122.1 chemotaxis protein CheW [Burkholderiales bacterium]
MTRRSKTTLREFQAALAERLKAASRQSGRESRLAVQAGQRHLLLRLDQVAEVAPLTAPVVRVARTQLWFLGVCNVRGALYAVTDLSWWLTGKPTATQPEVRLILWGGALSRLRTAVLVERVIGLCLLDSLRLVERRDESAFVADWIDDQGTTWSEVDFQRLITDAAFLHVAA